MFPYLEGDSKHKDATRSTPSTAQSASMRMLPRRKSAEGTDRNELSSAGSGAFGSSMRRGMSGKYARVKEATSRQGQGQGQGQGPARQHSMPTKSLSGGGNSNSLQNPLTRSVSTLPSTYEQRRRNAHLKRNRMAQSTAALRTKPRTESRAQSLLGSRQGRSGNVNRTSSVESALGHDPPLRRSASDRLLHDTEDLQARREPIRFHSMGHRVEKHWFVDDEDEKTKLKKMGLMPATALLRKKHTKNSHGLGDASGSQPFLSTPYYNVASQVGGSGLDVVIDPVIENLDPSGRSVQMFLEEWLERYLQEDKVFGSPLLFCEVKMKELFNITKNLSHPHPFRTWVSCDLLMKLVECFPNPHTKRIISKIVEILLSAIYSDKESELGLVPYSAHVHTLRLKLQDVKKEHADLMNSLAEVQNRWQKVLSKWHPAIKRTLHNWTVPIKAVIFTVWKDHCRMSRRRRYELPEEKHSESESEDELDAFWRVEKGEEAYEAEQKRREEKRSRQREKRERERRLRVKVEHLKMQMSEKNREQTYSFVDRLGRFRRRLDVRNQGGLHFAAWRDTSIRGLVVKVERKKDEAAAVNEELQAKARDARALNYVLKEKLDEQMKDLDHNLGYERRLLQQVNACEKVHDELLRQEKQSKEIIDMFAGISDVVSQMFAESVDRVIRQDFQNPGLIGSVFEPVEDAHTLSSLDAPIHILRHASSTVPQSGTPALSTATILAQKPGQLIKKPIEADEQGKYLSKDGITPSYENSIMQPLYYWLALQTEEWKSSLDVVESTLPMSATVFGVQGNGKYGDLPMEAPTTLEEEQKQSSILRALAEANEAAGVTVPRPGIVIQELMAIAPPSLDKRRTIDPRGSISISLPGSRRPSASLVPSPTNAMARMSKKGSLINGEEAGMDIQPYKSKRKTVLGSMHFKSGLLEALQEVSEKEEKKKKRREESKELRNTKKDQNEIQLREKTTLTDTIHRIYGDELLSVLLRRSMAPVHLEELPVIPSLQELRDQIEVVHHGKGKKHHHHHQHHKAIKEHPEEDNEEEDHGRDKHPKNDDKKNKGSDDEAEQNGEADEHQDKEKEDPEEETNDRRHRRRRGEEKEDGDGQRRRGQLNPRRQRRGEEENEAKKKKEKDQKVDNVNVMEMAKAGDLDRMAPRSLYQVEEMGSFVRATISIVEKHQNTLYNLRHGVSNVPMEVEETPRTGRSMPLSARSAATDGGKDGASKEINFAGVDADVYDSVVCFLANMTPALPQDNDTLLHLRSELLTTADNVRGGSEDIKHYKQMERVVQKMKMARSALDKKRNADMGMHNIWKDTVHKATDDILSRLVSRINLHNPSKHRGFQKASRSNAVYAVLRAELLDAVLHDRPGHFEWRFVYEMGKRNRLAAGTGIESNSDSDSSDDGEDEEEELGVVKEEDEEQEGDEEKEETEEQKEERERKARDLARKKREKLLRAPVCTKEEAEEEVKLCEGIIGTWYIELKKLFLEKTNNATLTRQTTMSNLQFWRFIRQRKIPGKNCLPSFIEVLYMDQRRRRKLKQLADISSSGDISVYTQGLLFDNFIHILVLIAQAKFHDGKSSLSERIEMLMSELFNGAPDTSGDGRGDSGFRNQLASSQVEHVFELHTEWLNQVFICYAMDDFEDVDNLASMNLKEFQGFVKDSELVQKGILTFKQVTQVFENVQNEDGGVGASDDDCGGDNQMVYYEFLESIAVMSCFALKNPYVPLEGKIDEFIVKYLKKAPALEKKTKNRKK